MAAIGRLTGFLIIPLLLQATHYWRVVATKTGWSLEIWCVNGNTVWLCIRNASSYLMSWVVVDFDSQVTIVYFLLDVDTLFALLSEIEPFSQSAKKAAQWPNV